MRTKYFCNYSIGLIILLLGMAILSGCQLNFPSSATATPITIPTIATTLKPDADTLEPASSPTAHTMVLATTTAEHIFATPTTMEITDLSATLLEVTGNVYTMQTTDSEYHMAKNAYILNQGGKVKTMDDSKVRLDISNGNIVRLGPGSLFTLQIEEKDEEDFLTRLKLDAGKLWIILTGGSLKVETPSGVASVMGSYLSVLVDPETDIVYITCLEGECSLENEAGTVNIIAGQTAKIINPTTLPATGRLSDDEVAEWLEFNPEATIVIDALTATSEALPTMTPTTKLPVGTIP